jgi:hypothetical protein
MFAHRSQTDCYQTDIRLCHICTPGPGHLVLVSSQCGQKPTCPPPPSHSPLQPLPPPSLCTGLLTMCHKDNLCPPSNSPLQSPPLPRCAQVCSQCVTSLTCAPPLTLPPPTPPPSLAVHRSQTAMTAPSVSPAQSHLGPATWYWSAHNVSTAAANCPPTPLPLPYPPCPFWPPLVCLLCTTCCSQLDPPPHPVPRAGHHWFDNNGPQAAANLSTHPFSTAPHPRHPFRPPLV